MPGSQDREVRQAVRKQAIEYCRTGVAGAAVYLAGMQPGGFAGLLAQQGMLKILENVKFAGDDAQQAQPAQAAVPAPKPAAKK